MGIAASMKELTRDILSSSEDRVEKLTQLRGETKELRREAADQVKDCSAMRRDAKLQLQKQLAQSVADRKKQVKQNLKDSQNLIENFRTERKNGGTQLRKDLAQGMERLAGEEKVRKQQVKNMLQQVGNSRREAAFQLRADLAQSRVDMKATVRDTLMEAESLVTDCRSARRTMRSNQQKDLSLDKGNRKTEVKGMLDSFQGVRDEVKSELNQASKTWKGMRSGRGMAPEVKSTETTRAVADLEERLLQIVKLNTGGITLSQASEKFGTATIILGKAAKVLKDQGKIRKEGKTYFPIIGG